MDSLQLKADGLLLRRLADLAEDDSVRVEIVPVQERWRGLLRHLRSGGPIGVEYNVIELTTVSARVPKRLIPSIAARRDVAGLRLGSDG